MISSSMYQQYFSALRNGNRETCTRIVQDLLDRKIDLKMLYVNLFQKSLYQVGELWETNQITVAREHMVTALTESLLNLVYPVLFSAPHKEKSAIVSCAANEYHQIGSKIVADFFELNGWDCHFLGANTPLADLLKFIDEVNPDLLGLSLSVYFNMPALRKTIEAVTSDFPHLDLLVGGQAFNRGGKNIVNNYPNTRYIASLDELESLIA
ncbi:MAG TPA: cobalamin-binding protein [Desulfobacteraceae bacterium]|nr:cobalamin-binding protein [Desulfobacteraceae bacterium]